MAINEYMAKRFAKVLRQESRIHNGVNLIWQQFIERYFWFLLLWFCPPPELAGRYVKEHTCFLLREA